MKLKKGKIMKTKGKYYKLVSLIIMTAVIIPVTIFGQKVKKEESFTRSFDADKSTWITFENKVGELEILAWDKDRVELETHVKIRGEADDIAKVLEAIRTSPVSKRTDVLEINTMFYKNWISNDLLGGEKIRISLHTGEKAVLQELSVSYILHIPNGGKFRLVNKYEDVRMDNYSGKAELLVYDCDLNAGIITGQETMIELKYAKARVEETGDLFLTSYDSKAEFKKVRQLKLNSKYSELNFNSTRDINMEAYDDKIFIEAHMNIRGEAKYTTFILSGFEEGELDLYDCTLQGGKVNKLEMTAKYSKIDLVSVQSFDFKECYDNKINIGYLGNMVCISKYTTFIIDELIGSVEINSYDDNLNVAKAIESFSGITMESKYTDLSIDIPDDVPIKIDADLTYTNLDFPKERIQETRYHKENSAFQYKGHTKGINEEECVPVVIKAYDGSVIIR